MFRLQRSYGQKNNASHNVHDRQREPCNRNDFMPAKQIIARNHTRIGITVICVYGGTGNDSLIIIMANSCSDQIAQEGPHIRCDISFPSFDGTRKKSFKIPLTRGIFRKFGIIYYALTFPHFKTPRFMPFNTNGTTNNNNAIPIKL